MLYVVFDTHESDVLIGLLSSFQFEGFQEFETSVHAYVENDMWEDIQDDVLNGIDGIATLLRIEEIPEKNWNQEWELSFRPVLIDDYCAIRASFHDPIHSCQYEIVIDPKMAFGTGHHETTELMIRQMRNLDFHNKTVLDLGSGTGILAILAAKLGAKEVTAADNDPEAVSNSMENAAINEVHITCIHGVVEDLSTQAYDIVLANINRNVLLEIMPEMKRVLRKDGILLLSGILITDKSLIEQAAKAQYLDLQNEESLGEWLSIWMMGDG